MATGSLRDEDIYSDESVINYETIDQAGHSEQQHDPNKHADPSKILQQRATKRQRSLATIWSKCTRDLEIDIAYIEENLDAITDPPVIQELLSRVETLWLSFESTHAKYYPGIKKSKRQKETEQRFILLQRRFFDIMGRCRQQLHFKLPQRVEDDNISMCSRISMSSHGSRLSTVSSGSSQKEKLRTVLLAKKKVELARARAKEEEEEAKRKAQQDSRRELRRLEEAATLAELEWKIETEYDEEADLVDLMKECKPFVQDGKTKFRLQNNTITHSPPSQGFYKAPEVSGPVKETSSKYGVLPEHPQDWSTPFDNLETVEEVNGIGTKTMNNKHRVTLPKTPKLGNYHSPTHSLCEGDETNDNLPSDPVAAMWKIQLLNGITPNKFSGNPSEFPFFRAQVQTHLESKLLSDAQKVEYLPKFLTGEALEVIKRNRGCSFRVLMETLEQRYGQAIQIAQACIEDLVSGPKLASGDSAGLLNFAERLNTATKVLTGRNEQEVSVATNLKRIVSRLSNDIIGRWQNENYKITSRGEVARLKDIATFVKKQAAIKNDPVFGSTKQDSTGKDGKPTVDKSWKKMDQTGPPKPSTIAATSVDDSSEHPNVNCEICKGTLHKFHQCPTIKGCNKLAVRRQYAASYGFCFNCGTQCPGHSSNSCPDPPACPHCPGRHLEILHKDYTGRFNNRMLRAKNQDKDVGPDPPKETVPRDPPKQLPQQVDSSKGRITDKKPEAVVSVAGHGISRTKTQVLLNVIPVIITSEDGNATSTYAFLDNGCTDTLIDQELADLLQIKGTPEDIQINTITTSDQPTKAQRVKFTLSPVEGSGDDLKVENAYILPDLNQSARVLPGEVNVSQHPHLQDLEFPDVSLKRVSVLVGSNVPMAHLQREVRAPEDKSNGLYAYRFPLGWSLSGPLDTNGSKTSSVNFVSLDQNLNDQVERFWAVEDYGAVKRKEKSLSVEDKRALQIIQDTTQFEDGHYQVGLLWKEDEPRLPNNRAMAERRLESTRRRLARPENEELAGKYRAVMTDYIKKGYARRLSPEESAKNGPKCWYLPHHPVTNPHKPDKVRIVFDAAAEFEGTSLNKHLLHGPDMTNSLTGVLLRFRQGSVGMAADIEAMFHQVKVQKQDQDALRFLWWTDSYTDSPDVYVMQVHIFGATSSPCVANSTLRRTAIDNAESFDKEVLEAINTNFYVDDGLPSCNDPDSAIRLATGMMGILNQGGFHLTKFTSNSKQVLSAIPAERRSSPNLNLDLDELPIERALGVRWFAETDEIGFEIRDLKRPETKRGILSTVCSVYDPLGIAAPVTLSARAIIQHLWKAKVNWDDPLDPRTSQRWNRWKNQLASLSNLRIPRCYFSPETDSSQCHLQLHHFSDASEVGYGTCSYLRIEYPDGTIRCAFIIGKSRNAPVKFTSIPRLELQAAVLATRMNKMLQEELTLSIKKTVYWTDSEIVLHYLRNKNRRFQTYVANRIGEIKENSQVEEWRHIPGVMNPADDVSRGLDPSELSPKHRWLHGPEFLWHPEASWPTADLASVSDDQLELRKESNLYSSTVVTQTESSEVNESTSTKGKLHQLIDRCSDWSQLKRRMAWLIRFTQFIRDRKSLKNGGLLPEDYEAATNAIARVVQKEAYGSEIADLRGGRPVKTTSKIANLNPVLDDHGVLRINGRIKNASVDHDAKHQIILPRNYHASSVLVLHIHKSIGHLGREHVIAQLRQKFWIPQVRVLVRSVLGGCFKCKKIHAKPMTQQMAPLPKDRLTAYQPPFTSTGMDMFGPLYVKHGRGTAKRWGCLFTCLTTRSIHLELTNSLETDDFIMCLRRFINRRGEVIELRCDNGSNFVGAERELKDGMNSWNDDRITKELAEQGCKWVFQPPTASSMSGVWERLVRSVKRVLKSVIGSRLVTDVVLQTLFTEVERILNGRALTANSDDPNDLEPLTPAHFLMQRKVVPLPPGVFTKTDTYSRKKWRQVQYLAKLFWERWLKEYLPTLQVRGKWQRRRTNLQPNDLVLLVDDKVPRGRWSLGRVLETYAGPDGLVRTVKVKAKDSTYIRPIQKLCFLENDKQDRIGTSDKS